MSRQASLMADQRGAVALEVPAVWLFLMLLILLPLADIAIAGFQYISARQALRNFGQYLMYNPPPDVTDLSQGSWLTTAQSKGAFDSRYPMSSPQVLCNNSTCTDPKVIPKSYSYSTTITITPIVLKSVLCGTGANGCTFTVPYSERFQ
ncbi:hypothetical protein HU675_0028950 [Bradyrhizobium septentrionale]|uniref:hypothetical protein n=1 Tax=Bradyrhizobium septentrionale TaxID=1404411 RepID=UPI0015968E73|nr:hypothetical protein [Bradyrhizobium septentrionale]UGY22022.1 hypothetical protein HU675_0028950 [Bradyrhizobium septentrionale]